MKNLIFTLFIILTSFIASAQTYTIQRGHALDDLYVFSRRNITFDSKNPMQLYYLSDYGKKIRVKYTLAFSEPASDINLKNLAADVTPGVLYCTSLENSNPTPIYQSVDSGVSWNLLPLEFNYALPPLALLTGAVSGEVIMCVRPDFQYGIDRTMDGFQTKERMVSGIPYFLKPEAGAVSGEMYGIYNNYGSNKDFILHSFNFGQKIDTLAIDTNIVYNPAGNEALKISHGTHAGEFFLITKEPYIDAEFPNRYKIYYSADTGRSFAFKSEHVFSTTSAYVDFCAGRDECSFYVINWKHEPTLELVRMQVYYSSDCAGTFAPNEHLLSSDLGKGENPVREIADMRLLENPVTDKLLCAFSVEKAGNYSFEIWNQNGQLQYSGNEKEYDKGENSFSHDCSKLTEGLFLITLKQGNRVIGKCKMLKIK